MELLNVCIRVSKVLFLVMELLSEFFDVHRGVRQGCPLSPLLFVLVSECFGQLVRSCKEIQDLTLPGGRESKISQYADDNTCFVTNDYGLLKVLDVFEQYGRASGAKLNRTKSKGGFPVLARSSSQLAASACI